LPGPELPKEFIELCRSVTAKRPRTVIDHILEHGFITTEELGTLYGYNHPPRAARDVRECGIPLETYRVTGSDGRSIGAYRFADPTKTKFRRLDGRTGLSKQLRDDLIRRHGAKCFIYLEPVAEAELQIDHRIPYEVAGDNADAEPGDFMLLCGSANRAKSWSCEHCDNWTELKDPAICRGCYWAYPEHYTHVAMQEIRRADIVWQGAEVAQYERLERHARSSGKGIPERVKEIIAQVLADGEDVEL
jgi:hypothetical protein